MSIHDKEVIGLQRELEAERERCRATKQKNQQLSAEIDKLKKQALTKYPHTVLTEEILAYMTFSFAPKMSNQGRMLQLLQSAVWKLRKISKDLEKEKKRTQKARNHARELKVLLRKQNGLNTSDLPALKKPAACLHFENGNLPKGVSLQTYSNGKAFYSIRADLGPRPIDRSYEMITCCPWCGQTLPIPPDFSK